MRDIIAYVCKKWELQRSQIELRLCKSTADIVQQDVKCLTKFDKTSDMKIVDILDEIKNEQDKNTIYLLYDIKKNLNSDDEDFEDSEMSGSEESSSSSEDDSKEETKEDKEDQEFVDIVTDILSLIVLNKKPRMIPSRMKTSDQYELDSIKDSQMIPTKALQKKEET